MSILLSNFFLLFLENVALTFPFGYFCAVEEDLSQKNWTEQQRSCKKKKAEEELLHNIDLDALQRDTNLSLDEIASLSGIKDSKNLGKWAQGKPNGSRPNYNAIIRLLRAGATQETLFGVKSNLKLEKNESKDLIDYEDPKFLEAVRRGMAIIDQQMKEKRGVDDESNQKA